MNTKILVIDDDPAITDLLSMLLKMHNFDVLIANKGSDGVEMVRTDPPSVVVLDLMMPDQNGWEVSKAIREFSNIPILILSAINDPSMVASVLDAGADDFLVKPVPSGTLVAHIKKLVRRSETSKKNVTPLVTETQTLRP